MSETLPGTEIKSWFYSGKYADLVAHLGRKSLIQENEEVSTIQIASLAFVGEFDEAERLFERALAVNPSLSYRVRCRFYLGVGEVRRSNYSRAISLFAKNLNALRLSRERSAEVEFYAAQGAAFFNFFRGRFKSCRKLAQAAYLSAFENEFEYGQALALDLLGHALCQLGEVHRGLFELERAHKICLQMGNGGFASAIEISRLRFRAQHGIKPAGAVDRLRRALSQLDPQNNYSQAELSLELARQLVLRGRATEAQVVLDQSSSSIYKNRNKRQLALYNHRYAYLLMLRGQTHAALNLVRSLKSNLDSRIDTVYLRQSEGLEKLILRTLRGTEKGFVDVELGPVVNSMDARIRRREQGLAAEGINASEDPLGDLLDKIEREKSGAFQAVMRAGYFGLLPATLGLSPAQTIVYLGPTRGSMVVINGGNVFCVEAGVTAPMKKLLFELKGGVFKHKEQLIEAVWDYSYDPEVHDRLLHATIGKIRKALGPVASWVEWSNNGYRLATEVAVVQESGLAMAQNIASRGLPSKVIESPTVSAQTSNWNHRQLTALKLMAAGQNIGVTDYAKRFKICKMTACRDLTQLHQGGRALRMGRARATRYGAVTD